MPAVVVHVAESGIILPRERPCAEWASEVAVAGVQQVLKRHAGSVDRIRSGQQDVLHSITIQVAREGCRYGEFCFRSTHADARRILRPQSEVSCTVILVVIDLAARARIAGPRIAIPNSQCDVE